MTEKNIIKYEDLGSGFLFLHNDDSSKENRVSIFYKENVYRINHSLFKFKKSLPIADFFINNHFVYNKTGKNIEVIIFGHDNKKHTFKTLDQLKIDNVNFDENIKLLKFDNINIYQLYETLGFGKLQNIGNDKVIFLSDKQIFLTVLKYTAILNYVDYLNKNYKLYPFQIDDWLNVENIFKKSNWIYVDKGGFGVVYKDINNKYALKIDKENTESEMKFEYEMGLKVYNGYSEIKDELEGIKVVKPYGYLYSDKGLKMGLVMEYLSYLNNNQMISMNEYVMGRTNEIYFTELLKSKNINEDEAKTISKNLGKFLAYLQYKIKVLPNDLQYIINDKKELCLFDFGLFTKNDDVYNIFTATYDKQTLSGNVPQIGSPYYTEFINGWYNEIEFLTKKKRKREEKEQQQQELNVKKKQKTDKNFHCGSNYKINMRF